MIARPVDIFDFRGMPLTVYDAAGEQFIVLQALAERFSLPWETTLADAIAEEGKALYGSRMLHILPADRYIPNPEAAVASSDQLPEMLCIHVKRMPLFLLRIDSSVVRAAGYPEAADRLLALQKEWSAYLNGMKGGNV